MPKVSGVLISRKKCTVPGTEMFCHYADILDVDDEGEIYGLCKHPGKIEE